ncbi:MAG: hypothetical protein JWO95_1407 [Verrucomicrobiales bacterium]|nr:hypothetical protein [Verrucomicrobiales bacterium]
MAARTCAYAGFVSLICSLTIALTGCSKSRNRLEGPARPVDPCVLLTSDEIKSVQGEAVQSTKAGGNVGAEFIVSQCYFTTATPVNSVVLTVTQNGTANGGPSLREFWKQTFGGKDDSEERHEGKVGNNEEEREGQKPERIDGVGEEAFWVGNRVGGALYVLKGNSHLRISVGGKDDQPTKLKKSKALAEMALKRL